MPAGALVVPPRIALVLGCGIALDTEDSTAPTQLKGRFDDFVSVVGKWKAQVEERVGERCVACLNGVPVLNAAIIAEAAAASRGAFRAPYEEAICDAVAAWYAAAAAASMSSVFSNDDAQSRDFFAAVLKQGSNTAETMASSRVSHGDTLSLVPLSALQRSVLVYAIVQDGGELVALEPVISDFALHVARGFPNVAALRQRVEAFCQSTLAPLAADGAVAKRSVVTLAVSSLAHASASPASASDDVMLLDITDLTPHLPTSHLAWGDVCSMLRAPPPRAVQFRGQKARVANLQVVDDDDDDDRGGEGAATTAACNEDGTNNDASSAAAAHAPAAAAATVSRCFRQYIQRAASGPKPQPRVNAHANAAAAGTPKAAASPTGGVAAAIGSLGVYAAVGAAVAGLSLVALRRWRSSE